MLKKHDIHVMIIKIMVNGGFHMTIQRRCNRIMCHVRCIPDLRHRTKFVCAFLVGNAVLE